MTPGCDGFEGAVQKSRPLLTSGEIEALASRPNVRRIAVENFLSTMPMRIGANGNEGNLALDAVLYKWNRETVVAIRDGIRLAFSKDKTTR